MGKQLIGRDNVEQYICHQERKLYVDKTMILSPGGKDYLHKQGIAIVYGEPPETTLQSSRESEDMHNSDLNITIQKILKCDYAITDSTQVTAITQKVLAKLDSEQ